MMTRSVALACLLAFLVQPSTPARAGTGANVARGKPYTLSPRPNYGHCTDPGDTAQLTDGALTEGYFWVQKGTVGWQRKSRIVITIDLGEVMPVGGLSFRTAAGTAGVHWPHFVLILVSDDGKTYYHAGDLIELSTKESPPPTGTYAVHTFRTEKLKTHGRFVRLLPGACGPYLFCDEIQALRGDDAFMSLPPGEPAGDITSVLRKTNTLASLRNRFRADLKAVRTKVADSRLAQGHKDRLDGRAAALAPTLEQACQEVVASGMSRAVMPLCDWHRRLIGIRGEIWRLGGMRELVAWPTNQWDMLEFWADPAAEMPGDGVFMEMMRNERRSAAFNLAWCGARSARLTVRCEGRHADVLASAVRFHQVAWTGTKAATPIASALVPLTDDAGLTVDPGMTRQVWLRIDSSGLAPGAYEGHVTVASGAGARASVRLAVVVYPVSFPERPRLHVGGWDYTDAVNARGVTSQNRKPLIAHLRERFVDVPWATRGTMPSGSYDEHGRMTAEPSHDRFDAWLELWPDARTYAVFASVRDTFAGSRMGTELFERKVATWARWWVAHLKRKGVDPRKLLVLLVDEPHNGEMDRRIMTWVRIVKSAAPEIVIFEDPTHPPGKHDEETRRQMYGVCDVLCANRPKYLASASYRESFGNLKPGQELWFYSCSGPVGSLDPYAYYRLQAWECWKAGGVATCFWAFHGSDAWNEYARPSKGTYSPFFMDADSVTPGKAMEAVAESVGDYEYLHMLKRAVDRARRAGRTDVAVVRAAALLDEAADRVLKAPGALDLQWTDYKDRWEADRVKGDVLRALVDLTGE